MRASRAVAVFLCAVASALGAKQRPAKTFTDAKPIAIVFPQFHRVAENDKFWGEGFTEWTFLRPMARVVNDIIIRKPHADIGYYNLLDYDHRRYMRIMADHFGIHGFNFYHFWFKDHPVMFKPAEQMLLDGEPDKPFFFTWANEPWSKRWDGNKDDVLLAQDYSDVKGNKAHFQYLLQFFKHKNYMRIEGKPIFCFYRIDQEDLEQLTAVVKLWQQMAVDEGLGGIFFMRFFGGFDNSIRFPGLSGYLQFEPGLSWQPMGGGPSIFPDGLFDEKIFLQHNQDILNMKVNGTVFYHTAPPLEQAYRTSQFKVYDKKRTWNIIERRHFRNFPNVMRGTFVDWNNSPRRNFTNGNYATYPHMVDPAGPSGFAQHLQNLLPKVVEGVPDDMKLLQLTAWNEWNEQSVFEPNDIDGYAALQDIKKAIRGAIGKSVVHVGSRDDSIKKYISDISLLFDHYEHINPSGNPVGASGNAQQLQDHPKPVSNVALLHIHCLMLGLDGAKWEVLEYAASYEQARVPIYITVHNYQFLFPENHNPTLDFLKSNLPNTNNVENTVKLFSLASKIIFPSTFIKDYFHETFRRIGLSPRIVNEVKMSIRNSVVTPHNDLLSSHDLLRLPEIRRKVINVAFLGEFMLLNGGSDFLALTERMKTMKSPTGEQYSLRYHVFGGVSDSKLYCPHCDATSLAEEYPNVKFHGAQADSRALNYYLRKNSIHVLMYLSLSPETYGYPLTIGINNGLAIVYLNRGAYIDRLDHLTYDKYFPAQGPDELGASLQKALSFAVSNAGEKYERCCQRSYRLQPTKWYISNYPEIS